MSQIERTTLHQVFTLQGTQGTAQVALLHRTITYDYDFIHHLEIFLHRNGYMRLTSHIDDLGLHTHTRHLDTCLTLRQSNTEVTIHVGNTSSTSAFHDNACTNQRFIVHATIQDGTSQFALGEKLAAHNKRQESKNYSFHKLLLLLLIEIVVIIILFIRRNQNVLSFS